MIGILCAIPEELDALRAELGIGTAHEQHGPTAVWRGRHGETQLILARSGIGKVNAAAAATLLLARFEVRALIFSGVAGGLHAGLGVGSVLLAERLGIHDYGRVSDGMFTPTAYGAMPFDVPRLEAAPPVSQEVRDMLVRLRDRMAGRLSEGVALGAILTADHFLNCARTRDEIRASFGADAVDMESGAVGEVARAWDVPLYVIRTLSDLAGDDSHSSFAEMAAVVARNSAACVTTLLDLLEA